jgi:KUP system potassium uptake protein
VISLVFWSVTLIVSVKYVTFIMRADDKGEGGIMALTALLSAARRRGVAVPLVLVTLGVLGASLFFGDGAITPASSVLGAVAGLQVAVPSLGSLVVPISVAVLTALFVIQRFGTGFVGTLFGPVMAIWFGTLALIGRLKLRITRPFCGRCRRPTVANSSCSTAGWRFSRSGRWCWR